MSDRRRLKSNGRVADIALQGVVDADRFVVPLRHQVRHPVTAIHPRPHAGARDRELAFGELFEVLDIADGYAFGYAARDGYVGYVRAEALSDHWRNPSHRIIAPTYWRGHPALKAEGEPGFLPIGARVTVDAIHHDHCDWAEVAHPPAGPDSNGSAIYLPMPQLAPIDPPGSDLVAEAARYLGVPYLWAGNSGFGIDCSGLVQAACLACGIACPGDSDMQAEELGAVLPEDAPLKRGDLLFWKGHVALVADPDRILHANAGYMAVVHEPLDEAIARIEAVGNGAVIARRRL
ncbi:NlpC/P60 family protein [Pseudooceanicola sp.]|uniref:C40 family peptidase n=1 Tax=Pseudooceanicola sp. TaxID=1914328 RepID=UPI00260CF96D|nr:NlpC/P60 family protein [Pseudooceanicola sp.]MDF1856354.1 NlpC/P60 family protein [Pseudooceanicola sp.]